MAPTPTFILSKKLVTLLKVDIPSTSKVPVIVTLVLKLALLLVIYPSTTRSPFIKVSLLNVVVAFTIRVSAGTYPAVPIMVLPSTVKLLFTSRLLANSPLLAYKIPFTYRSLLNVPVPPTSKLLFILILLFT